MRKTDKCCLLGCLCPDTQYAFISPEGAIHRAHRSKTGCLYGCLSHLWCAGTHDSVKFGSDAVRPEGGRSSCGQGRWEGVGGGMTSDCCLGRWSSLHAGFS